jgi:hypothetical protein
VLSSGDISFDDTAHFFGIKLIEIYESKDGIQSMQLTYREDGHGRLNGDKDPKEAFELESDEEITSVTVKFESEKELVKWINFKTTAGRAISMGQEDAKDYKKKSGKDSDEWMEATYEAPSPDWILGGIHGFLKKAHHDDLRLSSLGVYWVKKSNVRAISGGNILAGAGSDFLANDAITQQVPEITSIDDAVEWIGLDLIKNARNPVIMWQINPFLVLHRKRFLQQQELDGITNAKDFAEGTVAIVEAAQASKAIAEGSAARRVEAAKPDYSNATTVYYMVGAACSAGGGVEDSECGDGSECCSGLCHAKKCVHCLPEMGACDTDLKCCEGLYCIDQLCLVRPATLKHLWYDIRNWFANIVLLSHSNPKQEAPSGSPSVAPSQEPSSAPSAQPSSLPSITPSTAPSNVPSSQPSASPSSLPSDVPSLVPSSQPSNLPSGVPSSVPSTNPSVVPSSSPTLAVSSLCFATFFWICCFDLT